MLALNQMAFIAIVVAFVWSLLNGSSGTAKFVLFMMVLVGGAITFKVTEFMNSPAYQMEVQ